MTIIRAISGPVAALALALLVGGVLVLMIGQNPMAAYSFLLFSSFWSTTNFLNLVAIFTPLLVASVATIVSFKAGVFNIGIEGQLFMGAISAAVAAAYLPLPGPLVIVAALLIGAAGGALWGFVPAYLRSVYGVNEIVSTITLSYIAILLCQYLVNYPLKDNAAYAATRLIPESAYLTQFSATSNANWGVFIALALAVIMMVVLKATVWGQQISFVGENPRFAEAVGAPVLARAFQSMMVAGALAGVAGSLLVLGVFHRFIAELSPGYGFIAITVALLARLSPIGVFPACLAYAVMMNGAGVMQQNIDVPYPLVNVLQGIIVIFVTAEGLLHFSRRRAK